MPLRRPRAAGEWTAVWFLTALGLSAVGALVRLVWTWAALETISRAWNPR